MNRLVPHGAKLLANGTVLKIVAELDRPCDQKDVCVCFLMLGTDHIRVPLEGAQDVLL